MTIAQRSQIKKCVAGKKAVAPVGQLLRPEALAAFDDLVEVKVVQDGDELMGEGNCMHGKLLFEKIVAMPDSRWKLISIHVLREEGDLPLEPAVLQSPLISIHALREEGDFFAQSTVPKLATFLSTPSARRATAKTETKSLFSNKLYNILHEFRRALIYNGSKNYPSIGVQGVQTR